MELVSHLSVFTCLKTVIAPSCVKFTVNTGIGFGLELHTSENTTYGTYVNSVLSQLLLFCTTCYNILPTQCIYFVFRMIPRIASGYFPKQH
jgi:hypothetical protein